MKQGFDMGVVEGLEKRQLFAGSYYTITNLASDGFDTAAHNDANLKNPWGITVGSYGIAVANNGTGTVTRYTGNGTSVTPNANPGGTPTGLAFNADATAFRIRSHGRIGSSNFITVTEAGTVIGQNRAVRSTGIVMVNDGPNGSVYKGAAVATNAGQTYLYAADYGKDRITMFDRAFQKVISTGGFTDPNLPANYRPFNIQSIGGRLFVTYAHSTSGTAPEDHGAGLGIVDIFNTDGTFYKRIATGGALDAPWGVAVAPANFGQFSNSILVGNFGDGHITAYSGKGKKLGQLTQYYYNGSSYGGSPLYAYGLWGMAFGDGRNGTATNKLYITAGSNNEANGLLAAIAVDPIYSPPARKAPAHNDLAIFSNDLISLVGI